MSTAAIDRAATEQRSRLVAIAYRMLGSLSDAEDVVQDAVLRARRSPPADLGSPVAYLTTITTRLAIDHLRSARVRRESYLGPWLPEPVPPTFEDAPAERAELADSLSMAFLVVLETLTPDERAVVLLHDVFGYGHSEIADVIGRSEGATRQLLRRARRRLDDERPSPPADRRRVQPVLDAFIAACRGGDVDRFMSLLTADAVFVSDGGAATKAARRPIVGRTRISRFLASVMGRHRHDRTFSITPLNGEPAITVFERERLVGAVFVELAADGAIARIRWVRNPDKLAGLRDHVTPP